MVIGIWLVNRWLYTWREAPWPGANKYVLLESDSHRGLFLAVDPRVSTSQFRSAVQCDLINGTSKSWWDFMWCGTIVMSCLLTRALTAWRRSLSGESRVSAAPLWGHLLILDGISMLCCQSCTQTIQPNFFRPGQTSISPVERRTSMATKQPRIARWNDPMTLGACDIINGNYPQVNPAGIQPFHDFRREYKPWLRP